MDSGLFYALGDEPDVEVGTMRSLPKDGSGWSAPSSPAVVSQNKRGSLFAGGRLHLRKFSAIAPTIAPTRSKPDPENHPRPLLSPAMPTDAEPTPDPPIQRVS